MTTVGLIRTHLHTCDEQILSFNFQFYIILHILKMPIYVVYAYQQTDQFLHHLQYNVITWTYLPNKVYTLLTLSQLEYTELNVLQD